MAMEDGQRGKKEWREREGRAGKEKEKRKDRYLLIDTSTTGKFVQYIKETIYLHGSN